MNLPSSRSRPADGRFQTRTAGLGAFFIKADEVLQAVGEVLHSCVGALAEGRLEARRTRELSASCSAHVSWAMVRSSKPTKPTSPTGRRRYKERTAMVAAGILSVHRAVRVGA
jgi:hypothetical protein